MKHSLLITALLLPSVHAGIIDVMNIDNQFSKPSIASADGGLNGGLGTNVRVINGADPNNVLWTSDNEYFVTDRLYIPRGATLTIQPGTKVYFSSNDNNTSADRNDDKVGSIIACRGGKLIANGTAVAPITFTTVREWEALPGNADSPYDQDSVDGPAPTSADAGLWGGIVLLGQAFISTVDVLGTNFGTQQIEGFAATGSDTGADSIIDATQYGPSGIFTRNDGDNSGILRYISIRHGGYEFASGREINGLTLGGVGNGTIIENVEVFANQDDGIEFFGGTVNTKNVVMAFNQDDSFDMDEGYHGTNQFWFSIQNPGAADAGFESDGVGGVSGGYNLGDTVANQSNPKIYNATIIGAGRSNTLSQLPITTGTVQWEKGNHAMLLEDRFAGEIYNSVFDDFSGDLVRFNDADLSLGARFKFINNTVGRFGNIAQKQIETSTLNMSANATANGTLTLTIQTVSSGNTTTANVSIVSGDTRAAVTAKIITALKGVSAISTNYDVIAGSTGTSILIAKNAGANDTNLNIAIPTGPAGSNITAQATSSNTQAGANASVTPGLNSSYLNNTYSGAPIYSGFGGLIDGNSNGDTDPQYTTYTRNSNSFLTEINPTPLAGSPLLTTPVSAGAPTPANYRGAFGPTDNWAAGWTRISQLGLMTVTPPVSGMADTDGDGISDALEATSALTSLGFSSTVNNVSNHGGVSGTNLFSSLYTQTSIQQLRGTGLMIGPVTPGQNAVLTLPLFKSTGLNTWEAAGNATATVPTPAGKQFFRIDLSNYAPNP